MKLHPGDRFDAGALSTSISLLKQSGQFSDIDIPDPDLDAASMTLIFRLTPVIQVKRIKVGGAFPVFTQPIIRATDYRVGGAFYPDQVEKTFRRCRP